MRLNQFNNQVQGELCIEGIMPDNRQYAPLFQLQDSNCFNHPAGWMNQLYGNLLTGFHTLTFGIFSHPIPPDNNFSAAVRVTQKTANLRRDLNRVDAPSGAAWCILSKGLRSPSVWVRQVRAFFLLCASTESETLMKRIVVFLLITTCVGLLNSECQTALDLMFTNKVVSFTNLQGDHFTSAELVEADATQVVFKTNDIFGAVKFTDLSKETLALIGIPESRLYLERELEIQKEQASANQRAILKQEQDALNDSSKLTSARISSVISKNYNPIYGWLQYCNISFDNGAAGTCFIAKLPSSVQEYIDKKSALAQSIDTLNNQIDVATGKISSQAASIRQAQYQNDRN
ncbi:MAG TPA: hypothetical protein VN048_16465, partial [Verrucomicrobiae bacterium]|nr:hypothetical protein [Verrucomicrobiae bacterium]